MTEQRETDPRYADWREAYRDDVVTRVKHWGDRRKRAGDMMRDYGPLDVVTRFELDA